MTSSTKNSKMTTPHKRLNMGGIHTVVYNLDAALASPHPIAVLVASHGLMGKQFDLKHLVAGILEGTRKLEEQEQDGRTRRREIVIVTLDQRNHGERFVDDEANQYLAKNERHPLDLYSLFRGTMSDVSGLIDIIPSYLFPHDEKPVEEFWMTGISLGGHVTYQLLTHDPRVRLGIPIIGCPDYTSLTTSRMKSHGQPCIFPQTLQALLKRTDPINSPFDTSDPKLNPFWNKKLLVLTGQADDVVPAALGEPFYDRLQVGPEGVKERWSQEGCGHRCSKEMIERAAEFLWKHGLSEGGSGEQQQGQGGKSML